MRISGLWIHPIKSCRGIRVDRARVERRGFADDRRYMLVDADGRFISQREEPRLARVAVALEGDQIVLSADGFGQLRIPRQLERGERIDAALWRSSAEALVAPEASAWFSRLLERPCRLVYMPDDSRRPVSPARARHGEIVAFQDGYPFLLISEASIAELGARLGRPITIARFRPNIAISGSTAYAEDSLRRFRIGNVGFENVKPCARCVVITLDPETGEADPEPLRTLAAYRRRQDGDEEGVMFGVNLVHAGTGTIAIGDELRPDA
jgi:uncharacterized protein